MSEMVKFSMCIFRFFGGNDNNLKNRKSCELRCYSNDNDHKNKL